MKLLPFYFFLLSSPSFAQLNTGNGSAGACVDATIVSALGAGNNEIECASLNLSGALVTADAFVTDQPLIIRVQNNASLSGTSSIDFAGQNAVDQFGALAGLGGGLGGDNTLDGNGGGPFPGNGSGGFRGINASCPNTDLLNDDSAEAGGGGGGTVRSGSNPGNNGLDAIDEGIVGVGGNSGPLPNFDINTFTFAGSGGGGGGNGCENNVTRFGGGGGGGGGGIQIVAGGDVIVDGVINVRGGSGFSGTNFSGAGGGGSGGMVIIQTLGQLTVNGSINALAGPGGISIRNADGGSGSPGMIILQDADGNILCPGCSNAPTTAATNPSLSSSNKFTSDITCGTVIPNERKENVALQLMLGFILAALISSSSKIKKLKFFS